MMRNFLILLVGLTIISCGISKKAKTNSLIDEPAKTSALIEFYEGNQLEFTTLAYNANLDYASESMSIGFNGTFRLVKNEMIWGSFKKFGFEAARIKITPDSIWVLNRLQKEVIIEDLTKLQSVTGVPLTFQDIEQLLVGGSFLIDDLVMVNDSTLTQTKSIKGELIEAIHIFNPQMDITNSTLTSQNQGDLKIVYDGHQLVNEVKLAFNRDIMAKNGKSAVNLSIQTQNIDIDPTFSTPFEVPANYTRKSM